MEWSSPEVFIAIFGAGSTISLILQRARIINLPLRRRWSDMERANKVHISERPECSDKFKEIFNRVNKLEDDRTENKTNIKSIQRHSEKVDEKLDKLMEAVTIVGGQIKFLYNNEKKRNGG